MVNCLQNHSHGKNHRADQQSHSDPKTRGFAECQSIEYHPEHDHQHAESDPMGVHIYLADINVFRRSISIDGVVRLRDTALGRVDKCAG